MKRVFNSGLRAAVLMGAIALLSACVSTTTTSTASGDAATAGAGVTARQAVAALNDYKLGPGDTIRIIVYQEPDLSGTYQINTGGDVSLPLIGQVGVSGLTTSELSREVEKQLSKGYIKEASVAAEVVNYRPYYIYGEVEKAGEYPYAAAIDLPKAIAIAGGFTYRARRSHVFVRRAGEEREVKVNVSHDTIVLPGDTIRVTERFF